MTELTITLLRVACAKVTDSLAEGGTDEFGWRLLAKNATGDKTFKREEIPMSKMESVKPGSEHKLDRALPTLGPQWRKATLEFWEKDTFSGDDLLGRIEIERKAEGPPTVRAAESTTDLSGGRFRLTGGGGDYRVWLTFLEG
jgi:hypothetical protein